MPSAKRLTAVPITLAGTSGWLKRSVTGSAAHSATGAESPAAAANRSTFFRDIT
jgi:hypothetical protein